MLTLAASVFSIIAGWGDLHVIRIGLLAIYFFISPVLYQPVAVVVLPVALMSVIFLCQVISAGIMGRITDNSLRENLARMRALSSIWCALWAAFTGASLLGPTILAYVLQIPYVKQILSFGWISTTLAGVLAGKSSSTGPGVGKDEKDSARHWTCWS